MSLMLRCTWIVKASTKRILVVSLIELVKRLVTRSNGAFDGFDSSRLWTCFQCFQSRPRFDTFCDVSAFLVVSGSQPGMDVEIPELREETIGTHVAAQNFSLVRSCEGFPVFSILVVWEVGAWFRMILIPFHHSILWAFVLWISAWFRFHLETREDHIIAWIVRFRSWGKTNMYIIYAHIYTYIYYDIYILYVYK